MRQPGQGVRRPATVNQRDSMRQLMPGTMP
jgi:hypothetical protein